MASDPNSPELLPGLRVDVAALRRRGEDRHRIRVDLPAAWMGAVLAQTDAAVRDAGHADVEILLPTEGAVIATARLVFAFTVPCGRCLEPAWVRENTEVSGTYMVGTALPAPSGPRGTDDEEEAGLGLSEDDLDTWVFDGTTVTLDPFIAEQVKLAYPMRALCKLGEACRGLCSNCGADLNVEAPSGGRCVTCQAEVGPVLGEPDPAQTAESDQAGRADREGPMAAALKKLQLPD